MTPRQLIEPARLAGAAVLRTQSDERLVDLVREGNERAFEAIVHRYRRPLLRYCGRFLAPARAEDAVQQAFVNAFGALTTSDREIQLRPWLYRIAHNAALNALRQAGAAHEQVSEEIDGVETPSIQRQRPASVTRVHDPRGGAGVRRAARPAPSWPVAARRLPGAAGAEAVTGPSGGHPGRRRPSLPS